MKPWLQKKKKLSKTYLVTRLMKLGDYPIKKLMHNKIQTSREHKNPNFSTFGDKTML